MIRWLVALVMSLSCFRLDSAVYDCFTFFNELDLLEVRLHELDDVVDYFVIVESVETFKGNVKPLYFLQNRERFAKFKDKIIHVPLYTRQPGVTPWHREHYQRHQIQQGLKGCNSDDVVIVSDVDEIIRADALQEVVHSLERDPHRIYGFMQRLHRYYLNTYYEPSGIFPAKWIGPAATTFQHFIACGGAQHLREKRIDDVIVPDGGWHFSSMGGDEAVRYKVASFSHTTAESWGGPAKSVSEVQNYPSCFCVEESQDYPQYILDRIEYFQKIGFIYPTATAQTHRERGCVRTQ